MDRKALTREYKERQHPMGVFRVMNTLNGRSFIGTNRNLTAILNRHRAQLQMKGHPNHALQTDWNEHGSEAFVFEVLDTLEPPTEPGYDPTDDLRELEKLWLEKLQPFGYTAENK